MPDPAIRREPCATRRYAAGDARPGVGARPGVVQVTFPIEGLSQDHLRFEVDEAYADFVDDSCDAAVVALLPVAMKVLGRRDGGGRPRAGRTGRSREWTAAEPSGVAGRLSASLDWRFRLTACRCSNA